MSENLHNVGCDGIHCRCGLALDDRREWARKRDAWYASLRALDFTREPRPLDLDPEAALHGKEPCHE